MEIGSQDGATLLGPNTDARAKRMYGPALARHGFTLVELLVVIAIIGILVSLLLPAVNSAREAARRTQCINHVKQLALAVHNYHSAKRELPPSRIADHQATWLFLILPYMEEATVSSQWDFSTGCFYDQPEELRTIIVGNFLCPSQEHASPIVGLRPDSVHGHPGQDYMGSISDYQASSGSTCQGLAFPGPYFAEVDGAMIHGNYPEFPGHPRQLTSWRSRTSFKRIKDGTSKTLLCGEVSKSTAEESHAFNGDHNRGQLTGEMLPFAQTPNEGGFGSAHPGVINFGMVDGSVQSISFSIDPAVVDRMATRAAGDYYDINGTAESCLDDTPPPF